MDYPEPRNQNTTDAAEVISRFCNGMSAHERAAFIGIMARDHRTLQQGFTKVCVDWLLHLSQVEHYDGRNEASVKLAKRLVGDLDKYDLHLPLI